MATLTRYPTGDDAASGTWSVYPTSPTTKYDKVDDTTADNDSTYIEGSTSNGYACFTFSAFDVPAGSTISEVRVYYTMRKTSTPVANGFPCIKTGTTQRTGTASGNPTQSYVERSVAWTTNPATSAAWTVDEVNGTDSETTHRLTAFGVGGADMSPSLRFTAVRCVVTYTEGIEERTMTASGACVATSATASLSYTPPEKTMTASGSADYTDGAATLSIGPAAVFGTASGLAPPTTGAATLTPFTFDDEAFSGDAFDAYLAGGEVTMTASGSAVATSGAATLGYTPPAKTMTASGAVSPTSGAATLTYAGQYPMTATGACVATSATASLGYTTPAKTITATGSATYVTGAATLGYAGQYPMTASGACTPTSGTASLSYTTPTKTMTASGASAPTSGVATLGYAGQYPMTASGASVPTSATGTLAYTTPTKTVTASGSVEPTTGYANMVVGSEVTMTASGACVPTSGAATLSYATPEKSFSGTGAAAAVSGAATLGYTSPAKSFSSTGTTSPASGAATLGYTSPAKTMTASGACVPTTGAATVTVLNSLDITGSGAVTPASATGTLAYTSPVKTITASGTAVPVTGAASLAYTSPVKTITASGACTPTTGGAAVTIGWTFHGEAFDNDAFKAAESSGTILTFSSGGVTVSVSATASLSYTTPANSIAASGAAAPTSGAASLQVGDVVEFAGSGAAVSTTATATLGYTTSAKSFTAAGTCTPVSAAATVRVDHPYAFCGLGFDIEAFHANEVFAFTASGACAPARTHRIRSNTETDRTIWHDLSLNHRNATLYNFTGEPVARPRTNVETDRSKWHDQSGYIDNNDGVLNGFSYTESSGWATSPDRLVFDGVSDYVSVPDSAALRPGTGNYAFEIWFYAPWTQDPVTPTWSGIFGKGFSTVAPLGTFGLAASATSLVIPRFQDVYSAGAFNANYPFPTLATGLHQLVVSRISGTYYFYVDGSQIGTQTPPNLADLNSSSILELGRAGGRYWGSAVRTLRYYVGRGIYSNEVSANYASGPDGPVHTDACTYMKLELMASKAVRAYGWQDNEPCLWSSGLNTSAAVARFDWSPGLSDFTCETVVKLEQRAENHGLFVGSNYNGPLGWGIYSNGSNSIRPFICQATWTDRLEVPHTTISNGILNRWVHVIATFDRDGLLRLYVDGEEISTRDISAYAALDLNAGVGQLFGYGTTYSSWCLRGGLKCVRLYDQALSPAAVQILTAGGYDPVLMPSAPVLDLRANKACAGAEVGYTPPACVFTGFGWVEIPEGEGYFEVPVESGYIYDYSPSRRVLVATSSVLRRTPNPGVMEKTSTVLGRTPLPSVKRVVSRVRRR